MLRLSIKVDFVAQHGQRRDSLYIIGNWPEWVQCS